MSEKLYGLEYLQEISGGDAEFVNEMVRTFVENAPIDIDKIKRMVDAKDWQKAGAEAHRFASSLLFLQLDSLKAIAVEIEDRGIRQDGVEIIPDLLVDLKNGCNLIIKALKEDFAI